MIDLSSPAAAPGTTPNGIVRFRRSSAALAMAAMLTIVILFPAHGRASDGVSQVPATADRGRWFGWQIALVDVGAIGLIAGGGALTSSSTGFALLPILGGATYFVGGPIVHALHDDSHGAWRSLLFRVAVPVGSAAVVGGLAALTAKDERSDICFPRGQRACAFVFGAVAGFGIGMIGAMVTDWIVSSEPPPSSTAAGSTTRGGVLTWSLAVLPQPGGSTFAVAGRF